MKPSTTVTIYFDYLCPYAFRASRLINEIEQTRPEVAVTWRFFSIEQTNAQKYGRNEDWNLWEQPLDYDQLWRSRRRRGLVPFLMTHAVQLQNPARLPMFRLAVFDAFHNDHADISSPAVLLELAGQCGLNVDALRPAWDTPAARQRLRDDIETGLGEGVFGVPTLSINDSEPTYMRLSQFPTDPAERQTLFDELTHTLTERPYLLELKQAAAG
ncbi:MAG: DsbA family protein [Anaerolineae bacterium]